jgi:hypothetical protein
MLFSSSVKPRTVSASCLALALLAVTVPSVAQVRLDGVIQEGGSGLFSRAPDEFRVFRDGELKGARKVAISVFNVAFPSKNTFSANTKGSTIGWSSSHESSMETEISGIDPGTQQRIADKAYGLFVEQLKAAGYEVVDPAELARLAPEFAKWEVLPNFSQGRYGSYVAPTGRPLFFLPGDVSNRDTSGTFGLLNAIVSRGVDGTQAYKRSAYVAHDGGIGVIAVTLIIDYGVYSSSGERHSFMGTSKVGFKPGVTIGAGNHIDSGSLIEYWSPDSGGFPAQAFLQIPVRSEAPFWIADGFNNTQDLVVEGRTVKRASIAADPAKFEAAANDVTALVTTKLVKVMTDGR